MIQDGMSEDLVALGGKFGVAITAGQTLQLKVGKGRLCRVSFTVAGTGTGDVQFLDAPSIANSGWVIARFAATTGTLPTNGAPVQFDLPFFQGLAVVNPASGPTVYVTWD